jgi:predicted Rossmann-fold nucleotide-binding protein
VGLLDTGGYYGRLLQFLQESVGHGFMNARQMELLTVDSEPARLLARLVRDSGVDPRPVDVSQI